MTRLVAGLWGLTNLSTDYRLPTTDYRLPTTDYRLPTTDYRPNITKSSFFGHKPVRCVRLFLSQRLFLQSAGHMKRKGKSNVYDKRTASLPQDRFEDLDRRGSRGCPAFDPGRHSRRRHLFLCDSGEDRSAAGSELRQRGGCRFAGRRLRSCSVPRQPGFRRGQQRLQLRVRWPWSGRTSGRPSAKALLQGIRRPGWRRPG